MLYSAKEMTGLAERFRVDYNTVRPHFSFGYRLPATGHRRLPDKEFGLWRSGNRYALHIHPTATIHQQKSVR